MSVAFHRRTANNVLRSLSALGARVECRGERIVLRAGARRVPPELVAAAREARADLAKMLNRPKVPDNGEGEHLRLPGTGDPSFSAPFAEDAQVSAFAEHLRSESARPAKTLTEDAQLGAFDKDEGFSGVGALPMPKALNCLDVVTFAQDERTHPNWSEAEAQRAAIVQHDSGIPRGWAEGFARLDPGRPPADVPLERWQRFVDDVGLFLDSPFCAVAAALGWGPYDLFGCDRDRPFTRIDHGLLWLLNGGRLAHRTRHA